jgi:putative MFS transporter
MAPSDSTRSEGLSTSRRPLASVPGSAAASITELLDRETKLTGNQYRIVTAAVLGDMMEFFDFFIIGFVLAFIMRPWGLTYGQSAIILLSSGAGAIVGAFMWGYIADRIGRRPVFMCTVINFSVATGILALTPEHNWLFLVVFRFVVGIGVGGLYSVDLPLVQEFVPTAKRGFIGGIVTCFVPLGIMLGSLLAATLTPYIGWRGLVAGGLSPALLTLLSRAWVPESPRWLARMGRIEEARKSLAWALEVEPESIRLSAVHQPAATKPHFRELFRYPRSLIVSWFGNLGAQTGVYGINLWTPALLVLLLKVTPARASFLMLFIALGGLTGRLAFSWLSEAIGRRASGGLLGFGAAVGLILAATFHDAMIGTVSVFWLLMICTHFFADGGFAVVGPYSAEVWPATLRATGMGSAYGFGGLGKILGPLGLALIVGVSDVVTPQAAVDAIVPAFGYLAGWYVLAGLIYSILGIEVKGRSFEEIEEQLTAQGHSTASTLITDGVRATAGDVVLPPSSTERIGAAGSGQK